MNLSRASLLTVAISILSIELAYGSQVIPAAFDRSRDGYVSSLRSAEGDAVQFSDSGPKDCAHRHFGDACLVFNGRRLFDLETGTERLIDERPAAQPCSFKEEARGELDFELQDASGKTRYRGNYHPFHKNERYVDPACRRFVYLNRRGRLTVVDLSSFKDKELRDVTTWSANDRVIFGEDYDAKGSLHRKFVYDYRSGTLCTGYEPINCAIAPNLAEPALDEWYRPLPATARVSNENYKPDFELIDASGTVRYRGSFYLDSTYAAPEYAFSHGGRWFAFVDRSKRVVLVDLRDFNARTIGKYPESTPRFSTGGGFLVDRLGLIDPETGNRTAIPSVAANSTPDDRWAVLYSKVGAALYSFSAGTTTAVLTSRAPNSGIQYSPSGKYAFLDISRYGEEPSFSVHEIPGGRLAARARGKWAKMVFGPGDRYMAVARKDIGGDSWRRLELWDLRYAVPLNYDFPVERVMYEFSFTGSGRWLAFYTSGSLKAWRLPRGDIQRAVIASLIEAEAAVVARLKQGREEALAASAAAYAGKAKALRPEKGEFESGAEYAVRMKAADEQESLVIREQEGESRRIAAAWDLKAREENARARETVEAALDEEVEEAAKVTLGAYDADAQEFAASFKADETARSARLRVARADAPAAKGRTMAASVVYRHRLESGRPVRENLRVVVTDPVLGEVYSWSSTAGTVRRSAAAPAAPARLDLKAEFADADGDGRLASGETAKLTVTVTNSGAGAAYGVSASLEPASVVGLSYASRHFIGEVPADSSRTVSIPLKALAGVADESRVLTLSAVDANGFTADPFRVVFETRARRGARLALVEFKIKEAGGDGIVTPGELVEVLLRLRNDGAGAAEAAAVKLTGQGSDLFVQGEARRALGALAPGQTAEIRYTIFSNTSLAGDKMRFTAAMSEGADSWEAPVEIPLRRALGATRELVVKGKALPGAGMPEEAVEKPTARGAARADAYAVILGAEDYPKAARVSHARRDAGAFRQFAVGVLGVPDDAAHLFFLDDGVTLAELRKAFSPNGWLARRVGPESDVFVFYAGHGAPSLDGKGAYLVPQDGDPNYAVETGFLVDDMLQALNGSKARSATVWLDACFSGADRENRPLLADARPLMLKADVRVPDGKVALFSAASGNQVSSAYPEKRHGLFTWFSMRGLDGDADADKNGSLTTGELADFLGKSVSRAAGALDREQTPGFRGDRARVLATYRR